MVARRDNNLLLVVIRLGLLRRILEQREEGDSVTDDEFLDHAFFVRVHLIVEVSHLLQRLAEDILVGDKILVLDRLVLEIEFGTVVRAVDSFGNQPLP